MQQAFAGCGMPVQIRMIDGQLAFPDEVPSENWTELRVGIAGGMVSIRRHPDRLELVTWGNADAGLLAARDALALSLERVLSHR